MKSNHNFLKIEFEEKTYIPIREAYVDYDYQIDGTSGFCYAVPEEELGQECMTAILFRFGFDPDSEDLETCCNWSNPIDMDYSGVYCAEEDIII